MPTWGVDLSWVSIYPYQMMMFAGQRKRIEIRVRNHLSRAAIALDVMADGKYLGQIT